MWSQDHQDRADMYSCRRLHFLWDAKMTTRTEQLLHITEATGSKIYTRKSEVETYGKAEALVFSLKQYQTHYYGFYEKGTARAMVGLQGLHTNDNFWHLNVSARVELKSFCPWCLKLGRNTENIAIHLREVHCCLAIACHLCQSFASMSAQVALEHCSGCKAQSHTKKSKVKEQENAS